MGYQQVILTTPVENLGAEADVVRVRRGYARNFLIPGGKALEVTPSALRRVESLRARRAQREAEEITAAEEVAAKVKKLKLSLELETGATGKAFGSITAKDLNDRISKDLGVDLPRHAITLEEPIKTSGLHEVAVKLHPDVTATIKVKVAAVGGPEPEAEEKESGESEA